MRKQISRRNVLKGTLAAGVGLALPGCLATAAPFSRVRGANDDIRVAVVGMQNKGAQHVRIFHELPGVRVVALCDVDRAILDRQAKPFADRNEKVDLYVDFRRVLDDENIDAVVIATPDHWHGLQMLWACQAGKDVYVEKPVSHNIWEGEQMVKAARKYKRIVQAGTQRRSDPGMQEAVQYLQEGNLGKILLARALCFGRRMSLGRVSGPQPIPEGVDYNLWTGPAPLEPLKRKQLHYDWRFFWDVGCGDQPNNGVHFVDLCRWLLQQDDLSVPVVSVAGRYEWADDGETPNTHIVLWDYKPAPILLELRNLPRAKGDPAMDHYRGVRFGIVIECEHGYLAGGWAYDNEGNKLKQFLLDDGAGHQANFIKAVRSRNPADLNADILEGHLSTVLCLLGNISHRAGQETSCERVREALRRSAPAAEAFERFEQHLIANEIDVSETCATLGEWLRYDPNRERFDHLGPTAGLLANTLLRRSYREPFVMPERV